MDRYDAIREQVKGAQSRGLDNLREHLNQVLDSLEQMRSSVLEALDRPADEAFPIDEIETSIRELEETPPEPAAVPGAIDLEVIRRLDAARGQSDLLHELMGILDAHAARTVVLVIHDDTISAWSGVGFEDADALKKWQGEVDSSPVLRSLVDEPRPIRCNPSDDPLMGAWLTDAEPVVEALLVPVHLRGKIMGAFYADCVADSPWDPEAIQALVAITCWLIDTLHHRTETPSPMVAVTTEFAGGVEEATPVSFVAADVEEPDRGADEEAAPEEPEVEAVAEAVVGEPEAEVVEEPAVEEPEVEAVAEAVVEEPEAEVVEEPAVEEPEVEAVAEVVEEEPEAEVVDEPVVEEPEVEAVAEAVEEEPKAEFVEEPVVEEPEVEPMAEAVPEEPEHEAVAEPAVGKPDFEAAEEFVVEETDFEIVDETAGEPEDEAGHEPAYDPSATVQVNLDDIPTHVPPEEAVHDQPEFDAGFEAESSAVAPEPLPEPPPVQPVVPPPPEEPADFEDAEPAAGGEQLSAEEETRHEEARRFARLLVSEIKLYNEEEVDQGRANSDIYRRLKEDIDRSREMYEKRISPDIRAARDYFQDELVRILADGNSAALGM